MRDLKALPLITIEEGEHSLQVRAAAVGFCGKVVQAVGVALPPTIREV